MNLLFRTYNKVIPLAVVSNRTLKVGDIVEIHKKKYYINCEPNTISPSGKRNKFYYCVKTTENAVVTNKVKN